ncbi:hypothetical protein CVT26_008983 [Gymnopilus dilepis]|uniref:Uncharacterized protein n=1 Tax=Gymnopilus dilepis TaxID=231916 RepID=A0A409YB52_9AGAR|nr:hypothetical protein CVT26_008983 [Gymnopilus dilepis]
MLEPSTDSGPELSSSPFLESDSEEIVLPIPSPSSMSYSSAKAFAALPSSGCLDDLIYPRDDVRLWQRGAVGIARFPLKISERGKDTSLVEYHRQINDMISLYNDILDTISWPSSWNEMVSIG